MATSNVFDGVYVQTELNADNILTDSAATTSGNPGTDLNVQPGTGDGVGKGGTINLTGGIGGATGDGGDIIITAGPDGGVGTQGTITFSALDNTGPLAFNETGDTDLLPSFTATSIVGALNELKGEVIINDNIDQSAYTSTTDLNYNGSTIVDIPDTTAITTGDWLVGYTVTFTTSTPTEPVAIFVRDGSNNIIDESKTFIADGSDQSKHTVSKQFVYTEVLANNTLKISYQLNTGAATTVAVEMTPVTGTTNPDQVPVLWANRIDTAFDQNVYTTVSDINYNGTTEVDIPGTITLTAGDWLIGYGLTLRVPSSPDDILVYVQDAANNIIDASRTHLADNAIVSRHDVSKAFIFTASATSYRLTFRLDTTATVSTAVEMSALSGVTNPDQVPVLWAYRLDTLNNDQNVYTTLTDLAYNGGTLVDVPGTITLNETGYWLMGYSLALTAPNQADLVVARIRDTNDTTINLSKTFVEENSSTSRHTVSRAFLFRQTESTNDYKLSFGLDESSAVNDAVDMTGFALNPGQAPVLWAIHVGDINVTNTFLLLNDTPSTYLGQATKLVAVNIEETGLEFIQPLTSTINGSGIGIVSVNANVTGTPAVTGVVVQKNSIMKINNEILLTAVFSINTIAAGNTEFTFTVPSAANFTNEWDITAPVSAWVDTAPVVSLSDAFCIGVASSTNAFVKFTAVNGTDLHYIQINARYTSV